MAVVLRTVPEPLRESGADDGSVPPGRTSLLRPTLSHLWRDPGLRHVIAGAALNTTVIYGLLAGRRPT